MVFSFQEITFDGPSVVDPARLWIGTSSNRTLVDYDPTVRCEETFPFKLKSHPKYNVDSGIITSNTTVVCSVPSFFKRRNFSVRYTKDQEGLEEVGHRRVWVVLKGKGVGERFLDAGSLLYTSRVVALPGIDLSSTSRPQSSRRNTASETFLSPSLCLIAGTNFL